MTNQTHRPLRPSFARLLVLVALVLMTVWLPARGALAQTVPGGAPPTSPIADGAPPIPSQPIVVSASAPLVAPLVATTGTSLAMELPPAAPGESPLVVTISISPATLGNVTDRDGNPVQPTTMRARPVSAASVPTLPAGQVALSTVIGFELLDANGQPINRPNFNPPLVLGFTPTPQAIAAAGGIENVKVVVFDSLTGQWVALPSTVIDGKMYASVTHFSLFTMAAIPVTPLPARLPTTSAGAQLPAGTLEAVAVLAIIAGAMLLRRQREQR
ncbi:MAG: hypothetical protein RLZZ387_3395 [Chloroflexota bacterium]